MSQRAITRHDRLWVLRGAAAAAIYHRGPQGREAPLRLRRPCQRSTEVADKSPPARREDRHFGWELVAWNDDHHPSCTEPARLVATDQSRVQSSSQCSRYPHSYYYLPSARKELSLANSLSHVASVTSYLFRPLTIKSSLLPAAISWRACAPEEESGPFLRVLLVVSHPRPHAAREPTSSLVLLPSFRP